MTVAVIALAPAAFAQSSGADGTDPQSFFVLNNPGDPNFNQLLGVNDRQVIVQNSPKGPRLGGAS